MSEPLHAPLIPESDTDVLAGRPLRWGFVGAGHIAGALAEAVAAVPGHLLTSVAARDGARARQFAHRWGAAHWHDAYQGVYDDPEVDIVYVNTTHPWHLEQALSAIAAGKHVLVEKPVTMNATQATTLFEAARRAGVFAMEAMWMRTQPLIREVHRLVGEGVVGDVVKVAADLSVPFAYDPSHRLFDRDNGGGALLDLGVYPATFAWLFLGQPQSVHVMGSLAPTGVDQVAAMQWGYDSGATAHVYCTSQGSGPARGLITGRRGWVSVEPSFSSAPTTAVLQIPGQEPQVIQRASRRYQHEVEEVGRCVRAGLLESPLVPQEDTIGILEILDCARSELGVTYPQE